MKLDRNTTRDGYGKYALLKLRNLPTGMDLRELVDALADGLVSTEEAEALVDAGTTPETEFFVIRLKDQFAAAALRAYSQAITDYIKKTLPEGNMSTTMAIELGEFAFEVEDLAKRSEQLPDRSIPD